MPGMTTTPKPEPSSRAQKRRSIYQPLSDSPRSLRLIRLRPGLDPVIECDLYETTIEAAAGTYKALSYTWHTPGDTRRAVISCNNVKAVIGPNLFSALRRLKQKTQPVTLWIDLLCINQKDDAERTQQVGMMRDIYANCGEVIIWLGIRSRTDDLGEWIDSVEPPQEPDSEEISRRVKFQGDERDLGKLNTYLSLLSSGKRTMAVGSQDIYGAFCAISMLSQGVPASQLWYLRHLDYSPPIMNGLTAILRKPWWQRIWVVQETIVAPKATVYYSDLSLPWEAFTAAAAHYETEHVSESSASRLTYGAQLASFCQVINEMEATRKDWKRVEPLALLPVLRKFRDREATDRRDKVFALIGLVRYWGLGTPIIPDYRINSTRLFWETTLRIITASKTLAILGGTLGDPARLDDPSWICDWSRLPVANEHGRLTNAQLYDASGGVIESVRLHGSTLLEVKGHLVDQVTFVGTDSTEISDSLGINGRQALQETVIRWSRALEWSGNPPRYMNGSTLEDAFWRTVCADTLNVPDVGDNKAKGTIGKGSKRFKRADASGLAAYREWQELDSSTNRRTSVVDGTVLVSADGKNANDPRNRFQMAADLASGARKFFLTSKGYMGTGPATIKRGDGVFVIIGSRIPLVLRASSSTRKCNNSAVRRLIASEVKEAIPVSNEESIRSAQQALAQVEAESCNAQHAKCFKVVGDAYVHGIMDGEGVWKGDRRAGVRRAVETIDVL